MNQSENENLKSKHSSGVSILIRIDGLWHDANNHSRRGLFDKWNGDLDTIWRELARDLKDEEYKEKRKKFDEFDKKLISTGPFQDTGSDTFDELPKEYREFTAQYAKEFLVNASK